MSTREELRARARDAKGWQRIQKQGNPEYSDDSSSVSSSSITPSTPNITAKTSVSTPITVCLTDEIQREKEILGAEQNEQDKVDEEIKKMAEQYQNKTVYNDCVEPCKKRWFKNRCEEKCKKQKNDDYSMLLRKSIELHDALDEKKMKFNNDHKQCDDFYKFDGGKKTKRKRSGGKKTCRKGGKKSKTRRNGGKNLQTRRRIRK